LTPHLPTQQATPKIRKRNHEKLERKPFCPLDILQAISTFRMSDSRCNCAHVVKVTRPDFLAKWNPKRAAAVRLHAIVELSRCAANEKAVGLDLDVYGEHTAAQGG
jgi:hypothetical protein